MFPVNNAAELTSAQLWLLHWLQVYDWAFSLDEKEKPAHGVIDDDQAFDAWYKSYLAKQMGESRRGTSSQGAANHSKVIKF